MSVDERGGLPAMAELVAGGGQRHENAEAMFKDLGL
jgi:hypothetical protein